MLLLIKPEYSMNSSCAVQNALDIGLFGIFPVYATMWCACLLWLLCDAGTLSILKRAVLCVLCLTAHVGVLGQVRQRLQGEGEDAPQVLADAFRP